MYIGVAGNIGAGKTTLTSMLAEHYGWTPRFEPVSYNPYLEDYYKDISRWSFNLEMYFLKERFKDLKMLSLSDDSIIQDRTVAEGVEIFVRNNYRMGHLSQRDYDTYMDTFNLLSNMVQNADLLIYIRCSVPHLVSHIEQRGRDCEQTISLEYLANLNTLYEEWMSRYKGNSLIINGDELDFKNRPEDFNRITDAIDARIFGLFA